MGDSGRKWVKMYTGQFERSIDSKNRVVLPPNIKNSLGNIFYLSKASGNKLEIRSDSEFKNLLEKIDQNNQLDPLVQKFKRFIMSQTIRIETDKLGRFLIPEDYLRTIAVKTTVSFVGMGNIIEIWATETLKAEQNEFEKPETIENLTAELLKKGFKL